MGNKENKKYDLDGNEIPIALLPLVNTSNINGSLMGMYASIPPYFIKDIGDNNIGE